MESAAVSRASREPNGDPEDAMPATAISAGAMLSYRLFGRRETGWGGEWVRIRAA
ncbi:MAG: hypothetical protein KA354_18750 [Phycisphaerae bacterium]|nr:hypothetical protein [Phycisphaerae bacterium]